MFSTSMNDFKIEKVLGKGSFGSVYLVTRKEDQQIYALKSVTMEKLNKKEQQNSVNEVRILASVNHPNVIGYKEAFWDDQNNTLNIVMEYADDGDLQTKIQKMKKNCGFFEEDLIWSYSIQMIEGLKALHDKKIMHRDLKSANIFLKKKKKQCKIGDMNVSKVIKEKVLRTQTGTPYYASPEVWNDKPYSYKSDLWSIGCVIYELCALRPPFKGKDLDELYINVCKGKVERINKVYSDSLWKMIMMLLQVDVNKRVNCDQFLNHPLIVRKIKEMKDKNVEYKDLEDNKSIHDGYLLNTINFKDLKELKSQLPTRKNYENQKNSNNMNNFYSFRNKDFQLNNNFNDYYNYLNKNINNILNNNKYSIYNSNNINKNLNNNKNINLYNQEKILNNNNIHNNQNDILNIINDKNKKYNDILSHFKIQNNDNNIKNNQKSNIISDSFNSNMDLKYNKYNLNENIFHTDTGEPIPGKDKIAILKNERDKIKMNLNYEILDTEDKINYNEKILKLKSEKNKIIEKQKECQSKTIEDENNDYKNLIKRLNQKIEGIEQRFNYSNILNPYNKNPGKNQNEKESINNNSNIEEKYSQLLKSINNNNQIIRNNKNIIPNSEQILKNKGFNKINKNINYSSSSRIKLETNIPITKINNNRIYIKTNNYVKSASRPTLSKSNPTYINNAERSKTPTFNYNKLSKQNINNKNRDTFNYNYNYNTSNYTKKNKTYKSLLNQISSGYLMPSVKKDYLNNLNNSNITSEINQKSNNNIKRINKRVLTINNKNKKKNSKESIINKTRISKNRHISAIPIKKYI